jgi:hypothetical protein
MSTDAEAEGAADEGRTAEAANVDDSGTADPCGCTTRSSAAGTSDIVVQIPTANEQPAAESPSPPDAGGPTSRVIKLIALLRPSGGGYRAQLSAGADNCDPELRVVEAPDLQGALAALPEVLAAAEARWEAQPRYPSAPRPAATTPRPRAPTPQRNAVPQSDRSTAPPPTAQPPVPTAPAPPAQPTADQLSLFG